MLTIDSKLPKYFDANGAAAVYWRLGKHFGLKAYDTEEARDESYSLQQLLARHSAAPALVGRFNATNPGHRFCLITEHASSLGSDVQDQKVYMKLHQKLKKAVLRVFDADWADAHAGNWGLMDDDLERPVIIDFSWHSFGVRAKRVAKEAAPIATACLDKREIENFISFGLADAGLRKHGVLAADAPALVQDLVAAVPVLRADPVIAQCVNQKVVIPAGWAEVAPKRRRR